MTNRTLTRWIMPAVLATGLAAAALVPAPARANDDLVRVIVDIADVVMRGNAPYYRHGAYGRDDRLVVSRDRYGRPVYHRVVPRQSSGRHYNAGFRPGPPPHARAHGHRRNDRRHDTRCDSRGRCTVKYYDPRADRRGRR